MRCKFILVNRARNKINRKDKAAQTQFFLFPQGKNFTFAYLLVQSRVPPKKTRIIAWGNCITGTLLCPLRQFISYPYLTYLRGGGEYNTAKLCVVGPAPNVDIYTTLKYRQIKLKFNLRGGRVRQMFF